MPIPIRSREPGRRAVLGAAALCFGLALFAARAEAYTVGSRTSGGGEIMTNEKVIALSKAGLEDDIIIEKISGASRSQFDLTTEGLLQLQKEGVTPEIIRIMWKIYEENVKLHDRTIRTYVQILRSDEPEDYRRAVRILEKYGAYAVPVLVDNLADEDERIRAGVCEILGRIGDPPAVEPLMRALLDRNLAVRAKAAKAISLFDRDMVLPGIEKAVGRRGSPRDGYALALGFIGDLKHQKILIEIADGPGPESDRAAAAYALGLLGDASRKAVKVLVEAAMSDTYRELREAATRALGRLAGKMEPRLRTQVSFALSKAVERYAPSRVVIARELRFFPGRRTVEALLKYLGERDRDLSTTCWESLKVATGETMPADAGQWRDWWVIAQLQPRWQGERFAPSRPGFEEEEEGIDALPGAEPEGTAAPEVGIQGPAEKPNPDSLRSADAAPELGIRTTPPPAPEDPFVR